ncbi:MAG TPA: hypothetical protein VMU66_04615 [Gaiellales bacterium]|nr:hypothetical protein [Gaiellales bacterium]
MSDTRHMDPMSPGGGHSRGGDGGDSDDFSADEDESGAGLNPSEAADLLQQTRRRAERKLDYRSPWLSLVGAAVVLIALGAVWLSVRNQHPYKGPTPTALGVMYGVLVVWIILVLAVAQRASTGVSGRSIRQQRAQAAVVVAALVAVSVYQGYLKSDGVSLGVVYGTYPLTAQLIVLGTVGAAIAGWREDWPGFGSSMAIILVAAGSAFAGPAGVWLSDAIGIAVVVVGYACVQAWTRRK